MSLEQFNQVLHPKMLGTIHLHELLLERDLDFFVMTISILDAIGAAMQSNNSAANEFLDHMAHHRQSMGLQATPITLGVILDVGHVEEHPKVEKALKRNGMYGINADEYLLNMEFACRRRGLSDFSNSSYDPCASSHIVTGMDPTRISQAGRKSLWLCDNRIHNMAMAMSVGSGDGGPITETAGPSTSALLQVAAEKGGAIWLSNSKSRSCLCPLSKTGVAFCAEDGCRQALGLLWYG